MRYNDVATYWEAGKTNKFGDRIYAAPRQIKVRWEDTNEVFTNPMGEEVVSAAKVYVQEDLAIESYLVRGCRKEDNPKTIPTAMRIKSIGQVANIKGNKRIRTAWL